MTNPLDPLGLKSSVLIDPNGPRQVHQGDPMPQTERALGDLATQVALTPTNNPAAALLAPEEEGPSVAEIAKAAWRRETIAGSMAGYGVIRDTDGNLDLSAEGVFNPFGYFKVREAEHEDLRQYVMAGYFESATSPEEFESIAARLRKELADAKTLGEAGWMGLAVGAPIMMADVTTLIPFVGVAGKAGKAYNFGRFAAAGAAVSAIQEAGLHTQQDTRTKLESLINVGAASALSGGLGIFSAVAAKRGGRAVADELLNPNRPERLLVTAPGEDMRAATPIDAPAGSVGAARAAGEDSELLSRFGGTPEALRPLSVVTPVGRSLYYLSDTARDVLHGMLDLGGSLTKGMAKGRAHAVSAEDIKWNMLRIHEQEATELDGMWARLNMDLGGTTSHLLQGVRESAGQLSGGRVGGNKIDRRVFHQAVRRKMDNPTHQQSGKLGVDDADDVWIKDQLRMRGYTDEKAIELFHRATDEAVEVLHKNNEFLEQEMLRAGLITQKQARGREYGNPQLWLRRQVAARPAKFRELMMEYLIGTPDEEWLKATFKMDAAAFRALPDGDPQKARIIEAFAGDERQLAIDRAQARALAAQEDLKLHQEALEAIIDSKAALERDLRKTNIKATLARARLAQATAAAEAMETTLTKAELQMRRALSEAAEAAAVDPAKALGRQPGLLEKLQATLSGQPIQARRVAFEADDITRILDGRRIASADEWKLAVEDFGRNSPEAKAAKAARDEAIAAYKATNRQLRLADSAALRAERDAVKAQALTKQIIAEADKAADAAIERAYKAARSAAESRSATEELLNARLEQAQRRQAKLAEAVDTAERMRARLREDLTQVRAAYNAVGKDVRTLRGISRKANRRLLAATQGKSYFQIADELLDVMRGSDMAPAALERAGFISARARDRKFNFDLKWKRRFEEEGFLNTDLSELRHRLWHDTAGHVALARRFPDDDANLSKAIGAVKDDYTARIAKAQELAARAQAELAANPARPDAPQLREALAASLAADVRLRREMVEAVKDIEHVRDRLLNRPAADIDPESLAVWGARKARQATYLRFADTFLLASIPDIASSVLFAGKMVFKQGTAPFKHFMKVRRAMKLAHEAGNRRELARLLAAFEQNSALSRANRMYSADDLYADAGIGAAGTVKHKLTRGTDAALGYVQDRMNLWNGMAAWNTALKTSAAVVQWDNLVQQTARYAEIEAAARAGTRAARQQIAELASLGIGRREASEIAAFMRRFAEMDPELGLLDPHFELWRASGEAGRDAAEAATTAIRRAMDRMVLTPGIGDVPRFMSRPVGSLLLMLQSFGFASITRFMRPAAQRILHFGDMRAMLALGTQFSLAAMATELKALMTGREMPDLAEDPAAWTYEVMMRTSFLAHFSPYVDSAIKLGGNHINDALGRRILPGPSSRYAERNWIEGLYGAPSSTFGEVGRLGVNVANGDLDRLGDQSMRLLPLGDLWRAGNLAIQHFSDE